MRDPIPGSDWRNDGGWAIVLERGAIREISRELYYTQYAGTSPSNIAIANLAVNYDLPVPVEDGSGRIAYVVAGANPASALIDHNRDGVVNDADRPQPGFARRIEISFPRYRITYGGGSYIRWANLQWCR